MTRLKRLFWNAETHRLRALWRLVLQVVLMVACTIGIRGVLLLLTRPLVKVGDGAAFGSGPGLVAALTALVGVAASMAAAGRFLDHRPFADFGLHLTDGRWWADFAFGLALSVVLMGGIFLSGWALGWIAVTGTLQPAAAGGSFAAALGTAFFSFVCVGIYEELFSRGYQLLNVAEGLGGIVGPRVALAAGCLLSSAVFGVLHYGNPNATLFSTACLVLAGLLFGLAYVITGELALPIGLHISWNFAQGNVFGFPVSGTDAGASLLATRLTGGPAWWTGGAFGPEAGASGLLAILAAAVAILAWTHHQRGTARPRLALARYGAPHRTDAA
jgi:membrane protease YdiL (CAAX protease family)